MRLYQAGFIKVIRKNMFPLLTIWSQRRLMFWTFTSHPPNPSLSLQEDRCGFISLGWAMCNVLACLTYMSQLAQGSASGFLERAWRQFWLLQTPSHSQFPRLEPHKEVQTITFNLKFWSFYIIIILELSLSKNWPSCFKVKMDYHCSLLS